MADWIDVEQEVPELIRRMGHTHVLFSPSYLTRPENNIKLSLFPTGVNVIGFAAGWMNLEKPKEQSLATTHHLDLSFFKDSPVFYERLFHVTNCPTVIYMLIIQLCSRGSVRACLSACWWGSRWQLHNSTNSTVDAGVLLLCYKCDKSLNHGSLIVPWAPNASACFELIVTQREHADSPRASPNYMRRDGGHLLNSKPL